MRFAEFHHRRLEGDLNDAALDVIEMIRDGIAPKAWWAVVLHDIVELLENSTCMRTMRRRRNKILTCNLSSRYRHALQLRRGKLASAYT